MTSLRNLSLFAMAAIFSISLASCSKKNEQLATDYAAKKTSAQTLIDQINTSMTQMKTDHDQWMAALAAASTKPGADTAKVNSAKADMTKHMADMSAISALIDSTKMYMNASTDNEDSLKNADDRLGTNFNDLNDKWKSFQDTHASLQQRIQQLTVATAGAAAADTTKAAAKPEAKKAPAKPAMKTEKRKSAQ